MASDSHPKRVQLTSQKKLKDQFRHKFQRLKHRHRVFFKLIDRFGMRWDSVTKTVTGSEKAWAHVTMMSVIGLHHNFHAINS